MADVKFPDIAQSNNNSFVAPSNAFNKNNLSEYGDSSVKRNGNDVRSQSFHSGRAGTSNGLSGGKSIMNAKKQRKE